MGRYREQNTGNLRGSALGLCPRKSKEPTFLFNNEYKEIFLLLFASKFFFPVPPYLYCFLIIIQFFLVPKSSLIPYFGRLFYLIRILFRVYICFLVKVDFRSFQIFLLRFPIAFCFLHALLFPARPCFILLCMFLEPYFLVPASWILLPGSWFPLPVTLLFMFFTHTLREHACLLFMRHVRLLCMLPSQAPLDFIACFLVKFLALLFN